METFSQTLRAYREQTSDPEKPRKPLTQVRFAELLGKVVVGYFSDATISDWEKGKSRIDKDDRKTLIGIIKVLHQYQGLKTLEEAQDLFKAGNYKALEQDEIEKISPDWLQPEQGLPKAPEQALERLNHLLQHKYYERFIGREQEQEQILRALEEMPIVAVVGLGGIGKTALVQRIIERHQDQNTFVYIVWVSAKTEFFVSEQIRQREDFHLSFDSLLADISRQCNRIDIAHMPIPQKEEAIKELLSRTPVLIILDNLETVFDYENLVQNIYPMLGKKSKLLITSRYKVRFERTRNIDLGGMTERDSIAFLQVEGKSRNVPEIETASNVELSQIWEITGGAPLAMKLVVPQMRGSRKKQVLSMLQDASAKGRDYEFYKFLYWSAWNLLDQNGRIAFVEMSIFPANLGETAENIEFLSHLNTTECWNAIAQLVHLSLVNKIFIDQEEWFSLHPLTRYFVKSDITQKWK